MSTTVSELVLGGIGTFIMGLGWVILGTKAQGQPLSERLVSLLAVSLVCAGVIMMLLASHVIVFSSNIR